MYTIFSHLMLLLVLRVNLLESSARTSYKYFSDLTFFNQTLHILVHRRNLIRFNRVNCDISSPPPHSLLLYLM